MQRPTPPRRRVVARMAAWAGLVGLMLAAATSHAQAQAPAAERQRIEALLRAVEADTTLRFDRNGTRAGSRDAVRFLRAKWARNEALVHSAESFIDQIASRSSTSGRAYRVCTAPTNCSDAGPWLHALLRRIEAPAR